MAATKSPPVKPKKAEYLPEPRSRSHSSSNSLNKTPRKGLKSQDSGEIKVTPAKKVNSKVVSKTPSKKNIP